MRSVAFYLRLALCLTVATVSRAAVIYEPAAEFSSTQNPRGVWSYGYSLTLGGALLSYNASTPSNAKGPLGVVGLEGWYQNNFYGVPLVLHNPTPVKISNTRADISSLEPGGIALHPGQNNEYAVLRFTAPHDATYVIAGSFFGDNTAPTTTDVHVLVNGASIFDGVVQGSGPSSAQDFSATRQLVRGDLVEFAVGFGPNGFFGSDLTGLNLTITQTTGAFEAKSEFSTANNPSGAWTFGQSATLGSEFIPFTALVKRGALDYWTPDANASEPAAGHNPDKFPQLLNDIVFLPHQLVLHPGPSGEYAIARWTAPSSGKFLLQSIFVGAGPVSTTDVHIRQNGQSIFDEAINGRAKRATYVSIVTVAAGDTIDFAVGFGPDDYGSDTTGLEVQLRALTQTDSANLTASAAIQLAWPTQPGAVYQLQSAATIDATNWQDVGAPFQSLTNTYAAITDPKRFYRLITYK
jgi:hypothetical protein